jgi:tRNA threonylcarbamoyladenosine biosynthesis protein TsaB
MAERALAADKVRSTGTSGGAEKPLLLAIDTATRWAGLALFDGQAIRAEACWQSRNHHTVELMPALDGMLAQQGVDPTDLSAVAVAKGPGSFTGLRIGMSVAKGLAQSLHIPIYGVPTLEILTVQHREQRRPVWAVIQAGRGRLCAAYYRRRSGRYRQDGELHLTTIKELAGMVSGRCLVCGELSPAERAYLAQEGDADMVFSSPSLTMRRPACLAELGWERFQDGEADDLATLSPIYLHTH